MLRKKNRTFIFIYSKRLRTNSPQINIFARLYLLFNKTVRCWMNNHLKFTFLFLRKRKGNSTSLSNYVYFWIKGVEHTKTSSTNGDSRAKVWRVSARGKAVVWAPVRPAGPAPRHSDQQQTRPLC